MKIETTQVTKVCIKDIPNLDTLNVFIEDFRPGVGRIIIEVFGESWASSWTGMGDRDMETFFCSCNNQYLIGKLAPQLESTVTATSGMVDFLKKKVCSRRLEDQYPTKDRARELYEMANNVADDATVDDLGYGEAFPIDELLGDEWWYDLPKEPNHKYEYLKRIVGVVQEALNLKESME